MAIDRKCLRKSKLSIVSIKNINVMKHFLFGMLLVLSCSGFAQVNKSRPVVLGDGPIPDCPIGLCPSLNIYLDVFNFHKPRTGCGTGFGFCLKLDIGFTCNECKQKTGFDGKKVMIWMKALADKVEVHIPRSIADAPEFNNSDMKYFEVEENTIFIRGASGKSKSIKGGVYPVFIEGEDLVVQLFTS